MSSHTYGQALVRKFEDPDSDYGAERITLDLRTKIMQERTAKNIAQLEKAIIIARYEADNDLLNKGVVFQKM